MATVINNPRPIVDRGEVVESRSGAGFVVGVIVAIILGVLLLAYAIPALRANRSVNIPDRINVDVNGAGTGTSSGTTGTTAQ
jgi:hypothetical protein